MISKENKYLDEPILEKNLVSMLSRHFGSNIAKQISISRVDTIEELVQMLNEWESIERENINWQENMGRNNNRNNREYDNRWKWTSGREERGNGTNEGMNYNREGRSGNCERR